MQIDSITLRNFRCFGSEGECVDLESNLTILIGANGAGKTALLMALSRLFGVTASQRRVVPRDFHLPPNRPGLATGDQLSIDVVFSFPELEAPDADGLDAIPEFFRHMTVFAPGEAPKARMVLVATWTDDGTAQGAIDEDVRWVPTLGDDCEWENCPSVPPVQRGTVQLVYVPASRKAEEQVAALLKGRLWRAAQWSQGFRQYCSEGVQWMQRAFQDELPTKFILERLERRWNQVHRADTDCKPTLSLIENQFEEFIRKADFAFFPDEAGQERPVRDLSDGQRSLFHIALTAATLEVERDAFTLPPRDSAFDQEKLRRVHLTILAVEEPENSLAPFFLSRIIEQARDVGGLGTAQVLISSHSPAILGRIEPSEVRFFRHEGSCRTTYVRQLTLPGNDEKEADSYVRLAIRAYPELYFARFVIFGEGDSEQLIIPRIAEAMGISLDPSFVPIVPLGGRYVGHFWRLLEELEIPYATLLDLDLGRPHGGAKLVRDVVQKLECFGREFDDTDAATDHELDLDCLEDEDLFVEYEDNHWFRALEELGVFFSEPLDIDFSMMTCFPEVYQVPEPGGTGPQAGLAEAKARTLKTGGDATVYEDDYDEDFRWYPYLFLNRGKPGTHISALSQLTDTKLKTKAPESLKALILAVKEELELEE